MSRSYVLKFPILLAFTGLVFTSCNKEDDEEMEPTPEMRTAEYDYEFNNGQVVPSAPYKGSHMDDVMAMMKIEELSEDMVEISVTLTNTVDGEMYIIHAHDAADANTTPNGTPYDESPNNDVFNQHATGNGAKVTVSQTVEMGYDAIVESYEGFFVVHDPMQDISTTDISSYLVVGSFARNQPETNYSSMSYNYEFNVGQVNPDFAYEGPHTDNLSAMLKIQELEAGNSRVSVALMNSMNGETYMVHAHDMEDPENTPNGTPYNETPNEDVLVLMLEGNGGTSHKSQVSSMSFNDLGNTYEAFFVVHDPLQDLSTTDPTTYVVLGVFADE